MLRVMQEEVFFRGLESSKCSANVASYETEHCRLLAARARVIWAGLHPGGPRESSQALACACHCTAPSHWLPSAARSRPDL